MSLYHNKEVFEKGKNLQGFSYTKRKFVMASNTVVFSVFVVVCLSWLVWGGIASHDLFKRFVQY